MSRTRRSVLTYASHLVLTPVTLLVGLVAVPFLLRWLGDEPYGAYRVATDWFGYLILLQFGLGGALQPLLARSLATRDYTAVRATLHAGIRAYFAATILMVLGGLVLVAIMPGIVPVSPQHRFDLRIGAIIAMGTLLLTPLAPFRTLAEARQRGYQINALLFIQGIITTGAALFLAWSGRGVAGQFLAVLLGMLVFSTIITWQQVRALPEVRRAHAPEPAVAEARQALRQLNWATFLRDLTGRLSVLSDQIIIALILGPALVVPFFVTQRLAEIVRGQLQAVGGASWAALAELHVLARNDVLNARLIELSKAVTILAIAGLVPIAVHNELFVSLWVGEARFGGIAVGTLAALNAFLLGLTTLWSWCLEGTGRVRELIPMGIAMMAINVTVSVTATIAIGLPGPLLGTAAGFLLVAVWLLPRKLADAFQTPMGQLARAVAIPLFWALPYTAAVWALAAWMPPVAWFGLGSSVAATSLAFLAFSWWALFTAVERSELIARLARGFGFDEREASTTREPRP
jgi:O-antigen/teichoic acid export membrane protein